MSFIHLIIKKNVIIVKENSFISKNEDVIFVTTFIFKIEQIEYFVILICYNYKYKYFYGKYFLPKQLDPYICIIIRWHLIRAIFLKFLKNVLRKC